MMPPPPPNKQLDKIADCCYSNNLTLNTEKTNYIIIKNYQNTFTLLNPVVSDNTRIIQADSVKFLGVLIDQNLSWNQHINKLRKDAGLIYLASTFLSLKILIFLHNALVNSKISHCIDA